jgi:hypothetical protein
VSLSERLAAQMHPLLLWPANHPASATASASATATASASTASAPAARWTGFDSAAAWGWPQADGPTLGGGQHGPLWPPVVSGHSDLSRANGPP